MSLSRDLPGMLLHDDVGFHLSVAAVAVFCGSFAYVVDSADVGVVDGGGEAGFAEPG